MSKQTWTIAGALVLGAAIAGVGLRGPLRAQETEQQGQGWEVAMVWFSGSSHESIVKTSYTATVCYFTRNGCRLETFTTDERGGDPPAPEVIAIANLAAEGWEVVSREQLEGSTPRVLLKRPLRSREAP